MKNKFKRIFMLVLVVVMTLGMSSYAFAAEETGDDHVTVKGVENGVNVKAYQIIKYDNSGYYESVDFGTAQDPIKVDYENIKAEDVAKIAALGDTVLSGKTAVKELTAKQVGNETEYVSGSKDLPAGMWLVLVSGSNKYFYNPAVVSVNATADGTKYGTLDMAKDSWTGDGTIYAKKSEPDVKKTAEAVAGEGQGDVKGVQYGDVVKYTITADIPDYTKSKRNIEYSITDKLDGLEVLVDGTHEVTAKVDSKDNSVLTAAVTAAVTNGKKEFEIKLDGEQDFLHQYAGKKITITYYAKVTTDAQLSVDPNSNEAKLKYSTNDGTQEKSDKTHHYTFGIDTGFNGENSQTNKTGEFIKVDNTGAVSYNESSVTISGGTNALAGAEFELHIGTENGTLFTDANGANKWTTDATGRLQINGLDSDVEYYLKETKAPAGYKLSSTPVKVKIDAVYDSEGVLQSYDVKIGDKETHYSYDAGNDKVTLVNTQDKPSNPYAFVNSKLPELPSTGGMGTYILTLIGVALMVLAVVMYLVNRRRSATKH